LIRKLRQGGISVLQRRFFNNPTPVLLRSLAVAGVGILLLPQTAYTCFDAISRALWRSFVSEKNLLEWTTAAESEKHSAFSLGRYIPSLLFWLFLFLAGGSAAFKAFSLSALCATPLLKLLGHPKKAVAGRGRHRTRQCLCLSLLEILHDLCRRRRQFSAAGQRAGNTYFFDRSPHVSHQYRVIFMQYRLCLRFWYDRL